MKNAAAALLFLFAYTISAVGPFISVASAASIPSQKVGFSSLGFVLSGGYSVVGGQPTGTGQLKNGNVGGYPEGACIPAEFKVTNNNNSAGDTVISPVYDYYGSGVIGVSDYEKVTTSLAGDPSSSADNLNDFTFTGSPLSSATSFPTSSGGTVSASITGPFSGNNAGTAGTTATDAFRHYNVSLTNIPAGETVYIMLCGRLGLDASQYPGSSLSFRTVQGGQENVPIPVNQILVLPSITINKTVVGGSASASDFNFTLSPDVNGHAGSYAIPSGQTSLIIDNVNPDGTYKITESGPEGYLFTSGGGTQCTVDDSTIGKANGVMSATVAAAKNPTNAVCNFTNTQATGSLKVIKDVVNDNGGTKTYADFSFMVDGQAYSFDETTSPDGAKTISLPTGTYSVTEPEANTMGYATSYSNCTDIQVVANQTATCTITNNDKPGKLIVNKVVENNWGGTKSADDFSFSVNSGNAQQFEADGSNELAVSAGTYSVTEPEANAGGYATTYDNCVEVMIGLGETATCTITNSDQPAKLILNKTVVNQYGGTLTKDDFAVYIGGGQAAWGQENQLKAGDYTVSESTDPNYIASAWGGDCTDDGDVSLAIGETKTCTITNSDKPASISGYKYEVNANATDGTGATGLPNWTICLDTNKNGLCDNGEQTTTTAGDGSYSFTGLGVGEYVLAESLGGSMDGWTQIFAPQPISLTLGQNSTGNDFGNFENGDLHGYKWNDLNGDGSKSDNEPKLADWTIFIDENDNGVLDQGEVSTSTDANGEYVFDNLAPATYTVCEVVQVGWMQIVPGTQTGCTTHTLKNSGDKYFVKFGNFKLGSIDGYKFNDINGNGTKDGNEPKLAGWTIQLTGNQVDQTTTTDANGNYSFTNLTPGEYEVCEEQQTGWVATTDDCQKVTIDESGETNTVAFGNQGRATITVTKDLRPANDPGLFNLMIDGQTYATNVGNGGTTGAKDVAAGSYEVAEVAGTGTSLNNYATTLSCSLNGAQAINYGLVTSQDDLQVGPGDSLDCTFVNIRKTAKITVTKEVINDNGGQATAADFTYKVNNTVVQSGVAYDFNINEDYTVSEAVTNLPYILKSLSCTRDNDPLRFVLPSTFKLGENEDVSCLIVNDDVAPELTVYKYVDNGYTNLTKTASDFTIMVDGTGVSDTDFPGDENGTTVTLTAGPYSVSESSDPDYTATYDGDCSGTILPGDKKTCTVRNVAIPDPQITVVKSGPAQAHEGDTVTYSFTVTNPGNVPFPQVQVEDDIAGTATYVSGDTSNDNYLDPGEAWLYTADYVIPAGQTDDVFNTVEACGSYGGEEREFTMVCDTDDHTLDVLHPALVVVKSGPENAILNSTGTYVFTIQNTGDVALTLSSVLDSIAGVGVYKSGDTNSDGMLDIDEIWVYTASYKFTQLGDVLNTVTVCGTDTLQTEVCSEDDHTTVVYQPQVLGLEDTGSGVMAPLLLSSGFLGLALMTMFSRGRRKA